MWDILVRKLEWAIAHGDRAAQLILVARLAAVARTGGPKG
jgi:hypothetical protein